MSNPLPSPEALSDSQRVAIDARIIAGQRLEAIKSYMDLCGASLSEAGGVMRARYRHLRETRGAEFDCDDETYWSNSFWCIFEAIALDEGPKNAPELF
jgi:hypothetical protein